MRRPVQIVGPSLLFAIGIIGATLIAVRTGESRLLVLTAPLFLAAVLLVADVWNSRRRGRPRRPSTAALLLGGAFLLSSSILAWAGPSGVAPMIPILGAGGWIALLAPDERDGVCRRA